MNGPEFLKLPEEQWPVQTATLHREGDIEHHHVNAIRAASPADVGNVINVRNFSSWQKLIRVRRQGPLMPVEFRKAKMSWIRDAQKDLKCRIRNEEFKTLSPFVDDKGIIRVGGRIDKALVSYKEKQPVLLPNEHRISMLITHHMHNHGHHGVATMTAKTVIFTSLKDLDIVQHNLSEDIDSLASWFRDSKLIIDLKKGKTEVMLFGTAKRLSGFDGKELNLSVNGSLVDTTTNYKYLGVYLDPTLNLDKHFHKTYKKSAGRVNLLRRIHSNTDTLSSERIYKAMIMPIFNYCGQITLAVGSDLTIHAYADDTTFKASANIDITPLELEQRLQEYMDKLGSTETFTEEQENQNTVKKTKRDVALFTEFVQTKKARSEIAEIPPAELNELLSELILSVRTKEGQDYEKASVEENQKHVVHATAAVTVFSRTDVLKMLEKVVDFGKLSTVQFVHRGLIRLTFKDPDNKASLVERGMLNINGEECSVTNSDRPHTLVYIHHYPAEVDDKILCDDFKHFGKVVFCKRQTFMGRPDLLTGSRILTMSLEKPKPAEVTIGGYPVRIWYCGIKPFCSLCKVMGHKAADCAFNGKCMRCGEAGHWASNCPSRRNDNVWGPTLPRAGVVPPAADFPPISTGNAANPLGNAPIPSNTIESDPVALNVDPVVDLSMSEMVITVPGEVQGCAQSSQKEGEAPALAFMRVIHFLLMTLSVITLNANSIRDQSKRDGLVQWLRSLPSFCVCCLYTPSRNPARDQFLDGIHPKVDSSIPLLLCGNFNTGFDRSLDRRGSAPSDSLRESTTTLRSVFYACCVLDVYQYLHPTSCGFTWTKWNGALASRIDLVRVPFLWITSVNSCSVVPCPFSDHCGVLTSVSVPDTVPPGPGLWKLNTAILNKSQYVQLVTDFWRTWQGSKTVFTSLRKWWEDGKNRLKGLTINYCKSRSSTKKRNRDSLVNLIAQLKANVDAGSVSCVAPYQSALSNLAALDREAARGAQYTDDTLLILTSENSIKACFEVYTLFQAAHGAKLNQAKSKGLWLGQWVGRTDPPVALDWSPTKLKILGVFVGPGDLEEENWCPRPGVVCGATHPHAPLVLLLCHVLFDFNSDERIATPRIFVYLLNLSKFCIWQSRNDFRFRNTRPGTVAVVANIPSCLKHHLPIFFKHFKSDRRQHLFHRQWGTHGIVASAINSYLVFSI
ncbi:Transposon TX1 uncharacterized 149 kDa protein [Stylophora pistillata]|uniref:Transposon TX1 uncharacterized 149 kDa protein n=1 Tax=Stylophora pistillata TaxID=50429 RepID=A0A2B4RIG7_STYPI|nr:Transposon TX1 uncharacterized 149 kDa protein [Stylophora pistillata]